MQVEIISKGDAWSKNREEWPDATNTVPNVPLLRKSMEWLESAKRYNGSRNENELTWNQANWVTLFYNEKFNTLEELEAALSTDAKALQKTMCGSNCCIAGNVAIALGTICIEPSLSQQPWGVKDDEGTYWQWREFAAEQLGLSSQEQYMFDATNDKTTIRYWATVAAWRAGEEL